MNINKVSADLQLLNTRITKLTVRNSLAEFNETHPGKKTIDVTYNIVESGTMPDGVHRAILDLKVCLKAKFKDGSFSVTSIIRGAFQGAPALSENAFNDMLTINGCAALYSIIRGTISIISTQLFSNGNIVLPLVNFVQFREFEKQ